ncbi:YadA-like family protein [Neisseria sp. ZJ106]|uniref:YadA-like family protein n=1 Tax=Neisseria lisongii TaxID=2912188 RepID=A0ABY7RLI8_9NEIS|nr:YadA-like family protein [Neisseria lisongii]MCF7521158.1 YadA-like family protein [Neisseria lisongii]WCL72078.1 YadA-like family protein [Neisseria lisongii]
MNKVFKVIWNHVTQTWVAASELSKAHGKTKSSAAQKAAAVAVSALAATSGIASAAVGDPVLQGTTDGARTLAVGTNSKATGADTTAVGYGAIAGTNTSTVSATAIGSAASASAKHALAIGGKTKASGDGAIAIGFGSEATGTEAVAIGGSNWSAGVASRAQGDQSIAIGPNTKAVGHSSVVIGNDDLVSALRSNLSANSNILIGDYEIKAGKDKEGNAVTLATALEKLTGIVSSGNPEIAGGNPTGLMVYRGSEVSHGSVAVGVQSIAKGELATAIGTSSNASAVGSVALGVAAETDIGNSVAIGAGSTTKEAHGEKEISRTIFGKTYNFAGGSNTDAGDVVSFGTANYERQLKNVAAGKIASDSTDGINGSQLYAVLNSIQKIKYLSVNSTVGDAAEEDDGSNINNNGAKGTNSIAIGPNTTTGEKAENAVVMGFNSTTTAANATVLGANANASVAGGIALGNSSVASVDKGVTGAKPFDEGRTNKYENLTNNTDNALNSTLAAVSLGGGDAKNTRQITGLAAGTNDTDAVNVAQLKSVNLKIAGNNGKGDVLLTNQTLTVDGNASYITSTASGNKVTFDLTEETKKKLEKDVVVAAGKNVTVDKAAPADSNTTTYTVNAWDTTVSTSDALKLTNTTTDADKTRAYNIDLSDATKAQLKKEETVVAKSGETNITINNTTKNSTGGTEFEVSLNKDINLTENGSLTVGPVKVNKNGIDAGNQKITNLGDPTADGDAVNLKTLKAKELHIKQGEYAITDGKVELSYVDGNDTAVADKKVTITGFNAEKVVAKTDADNIASVATKSNKAAGEIGETYEVSVSKNAVKDAAREAVIVKSGKNTTVTPTKDETNHTATYVVDTDFTPIIDSNPFEYVNKEGKPVVKATDGNYYPADQLDANGAPIENAIGKTEPKDLVVHAKGDEAKPITNVASNLTTYPDPTKAPGATPETPADPKAGLLNLTKPTDPNDTSDNNVATVGDLRNMGWVVSSDKKTGEEGKEFSNQVKNAGEVKFVGKNDAKVSANVTDKGVNVVTIDVVVPKPAQSPIAYTDAEGNKLVQEGDKFYKVDPNTGEKTETEVPKEDVIASLNSAGDKTNAPTTLANVKSNLPETRNTVDGDKTVTKSQTAPDNVANITNNAATVGDVLNAGWNLKGNGTDVDFVKPYDTVDFVNGKNTTVTVSTDDNKVSKVKVDVNDQLTLGKPSETKDGKTVEGTDGKLTIQGKDGKDGVTLAAKDGEGTIGLNGKDGASADFKVIKGKDGVDGKPANGEADKKDRLAYTPKNPDGTPVTDDKGNPVVEEVATLNDGLAFTGNNESTTNKHKLNTLVKVQGQGLTEDEAKSFTGTDGNINVTADGTDKLTIALSKDLKDINSVELVAYKDGPAGPNGEKGKPVVDNSKPKTTINNDGIEITPVAEDSSELPNQSVSLTKDGLNNGDNNITNVKGNLAPTYNNGDKTEVNGKPSETEVAAAPTKSAEAPDATNVSKIYNNAATVGDVLNAGWNLKENGAEKDFVKPYDTVNFVNGVGTVASVVTDAAGKVSDVTFNIDKAEVATTDGKIAEPVDPAKVKELEAAVTAAEEAKNALAPDASDEDKKAADDKLADAKKVLKDEQSKADQVVTADQLAKAVNNTGWYTNANGGNLGAAKSDKDVLVKPGDKVFFEAGKNLTLTPTFDTTNGTTIYNYALADTISFGQPVDSQGNPLTKVGDKYYPANKVENGQPVEGATPVEPAKTEVTLGKDGLDNGGNTITNVGSDLPTYNDKNKPTNGLVNLNPKDENNQPLVSDSNAATVGDLRKMGWIVSSDKTTGDLGTAYNDKVQNANEVKFVGTNLATVSGKTDDKGVRTITVDVDAQKTAEAAQLPVVYTDAKNNKLVKEGNKFYRVNENGDKIDAEGNKIDLTNVPADKQAEELAKAEVPKTDVIASLNNGDNETTKTPTSLANVKGNLNSTYNAGDTTINNDTQPNTENKTEAAPTTSQTAPDAKKLAEIYNNAATVGDVLNAGWNLKENNTAKDFVKPYDTVGFVDGVGTLANVTVSEDGKVSNVTFNIDKAKVETAEGKITEPASADKLANLNEAVKDAEKAKQELAANPDATEEMKQAADENLAKAQKALSDAKKAGDQVVTAQELANAVNNTGWKTNAVGANKRSEDVLVKPGDKVEFAADGNLNVGIKSDNGTTTYTYGLNDQVTLGKEGPDGEPGTDGKLTVKDANGKDGVTVTAKDGEGSIGLNGKDGANANITVAKAEGDITDPTNAKAKDRIQYTSTVTTPVVDKDGKPVLDENGQPKTETKTVTESVATLNDGLRFTGNNSDTENKHKLNTLVTIKGEGVDKEKSKDFKSATGNINVKADGDSTLEIQLAKDVNLGKDGSVTTGKTKVDDKGVTITPVDEQGNPVTDPNKVVSLTDKGLNNGGNKITNVAAGEAPTDGVNVSQLNNVKDSFPFETVDNPNAVKVGDQYYAKNDIDPATGKPKEGAKPVNGTVITAKGNTPQTINNVASNLPETRNTANGEANPVTTSQAAPANVGDIANNAATVSDVLNAGFNLKGNGEAVDFVKPYDTLDFVNGKNTTVTVSTDDNKVSTIKVDVNNDLTLGTAGEDGKPGEDGKLTIKDAAGKEGVTIGMKDGAGAIGLNGKDGVNADISVEKGPNNVEGTEPTRITYTDADGNKESVATLNDGLKFAGDNGETVINKKLNEKLEIVGGADKAKLSDNNIGVNAENGKLEVKLAKELQDLTSAEFKNEAGDVTKVGGNGVTITPAEEGKAPVTLSNNGLNNGGNKVTGVADGDISPNSTDAVNGGQIYALTGGAALTAGDYKAVNPQTGEETVYENVVLGEDGQPILKTYNVEGQTEYITHSVLTAIRNMNEQGIKFFHTNDSQVRPIPQTQNSIDSSASGAYATAIGAKAKASGNESVAIGYGSEATGKQSIAIGTGNKVTGNHSGAIGDPNTVSGQASYALGNNNNVATDNTFVVGNDVTVTEANSVALGNKSAITGGNAVGTKNKTATGAEGVTTTAGTTGTVETATVGNLNYGGFAGATASGAVSVGAADAERRIQNVAAGEISATSTDAINGSQLYSVASNVNNKLGDINNRLGDVNNRVNDLDKRVRGIGANAAATASLPQVILPGKSMMAAAVGGYGGASALAVGYSRASDNGKLILKIQGTANTEGNLSGGVGMGYQW